MGWPLDAGTDDALPDAVIGRQRPSAKPGHGQHHAGEEQRHGVFQVLGAAVEIKRGAQANDPEERKRDGIPKLEQAQMKGDRFPVFGYASSSA